MPNRARVILTCTATALVLLLLGWELANIAAVVMFVYYLAELSIRLTDKLAIREFLLMIFAVNYLLSPALSYQFPSNNAYLLLRIPREEYFAMMIPAFVCLQLGLSLVPEKHFRVNFSLADKDRQINEHIWKRWFIIGVLAFFARSFAPGEIGFFLYLIGLIRYAAAFILFYINWKKYVVLLLLVMGIEIYNAILFGFFHDMMIWLIFFMLFFANIFKFSTRGKLLIGSSTIILFLFLQAIKADYRERIWFSGEEAGLETFRSTSSEVIEDDEVLGEENLRGSLNRINQAWIFASTVDHLKRTQDFQGLGNVALYLEAAILPRFLAPEKLRAGDKELFNRFSGHTIGEGTSMGLGIMADGYIAYGYWGVLIFAFAYGAMLSLIFILVAKWSAFSPTLLLVLFPLLSYAVRPDCDTHTILGHIAKGLFTYAIIVAIYKSMYRRINTDIEVYRLRKRHKSITSV